MPMPISSVLTVVLVGTAHRFQCLWREADSVVVGKFQAFIRDLCLRHGVRAIAEEMSEASLAGRGSAESTAQLVCRELGLTHLFADPGPIERKELGIRGVHDVQLEGFFGDWSTDMTENELRKSHDIRERYWVDRMRSL